MKIQFIIISTMAFWINLATANEVLKKANNFDLPEVASRTYAQNYKDLALAVCIMQAYENEPKAAADAGATAAGLDSTWTNYDPEKGAGQISKLVKLYLSRQYNSIQGPNIKLDLMKCLDLYHSQALEEQVKQFVPTPNRTYRQDNSPES